MQEGGKEIFGSPMVCRIVMGALRWTCESIVTSYFLFKGPSVRFLYQ